VKDLLTRLRSTDDAVRGGAWQGAGPVGASAVPALVELMLAAEPEVARAAKNALWTVVHHAGRPGGDEEARAVAAALGTRLEHPSAAVRREVVWMLSEVGDDGSVKPMGRLLSDPEVREDARCALERMPGQAPVDALHRAFKVAPESFRYALAESLRKRGQKVADYPSLKLVPTRT
jgi:HEAT repeat protein